MNCRIKHHQTEFKGLPYFNLCNAISVLLTGQHEKFPYDRFGEGSERCQPPAAPQPATTTAKPEAVPWQVFPWQPENGRSTAANRGGSPTVQLRTKEDGAAVEHIWFDIKKNSLYFFQVVSCVSCGLKFGKKTCLLAWSRNRYVWNIMQGITRGFMKPVFRIFWGTFPSSQSQAMGLWGYECSCCNCSIKLWNQIWTMTLTMISFLHTPQPTANI